MIVIITDFDPLTADLDTGSSPQGRSGQFGAGSLEKQLLYAAIPLDAPDPLSQGFYHRMLTRLYESYHE